MLALCSSTALGNNSNDIIHLNGGILDLYTTDGSMTAYNVTVGGNAAIYSDKDPGGAGVTYTLGTLSIGNNTLTIDRYAPKVTSGTAGITFGVTTLTASTAVFEVNNGAGVDVLLTLGSLSGNYNITKQGDGQLTLGSASSRSSGVTTLTAGTLYLGSASALGTTGTTLTLNGGILDLAIDSSINAYNTTVGGNVTIISDRATSGPGVDHTLGTLSIGNNTLTINKGDNVTSGEAGVFFGATTLTANIPILM